MAEKELRRVCDEACGKFSAIHKIAAVHILGDCPVGQASVILACSSPHRRDAINCVEYLIDELKARVPIWKISEDSLNMHIYCYIDIYIVKVEKQT